MIAIQDASMYHMSILHGVIIMAIMPLTIARIGCKTEQKISVMIICAFKEQSSINNHILNALFCLKIL